MFRVVYQQQCIAISLEGPLLGLEITLLPGEGFARLGEGTIGQVPLHFSSYAERSYCM